MHKFRCLCLGLMILTCSTTGWTQEIDPTEPNQEAEIVPVEEVENEKVESLFESFRDESFQGHKFPDLDFDDIPALLEFGKSERQLKAFPRNMISSQLEFTCREGLVALWLVEGIRKGQKFPSLNALCLSKKPGSDWTTDSENNHKQALAAYQRWWEDVQEMPAEQAQAINPLKGIGLHWH